MKVDLVPFIIFLIVIFILCIAALKSPRTPIAPVEVEKDFACIDGTVHLKQGQDFVPVRVNGGRLTCPKKTPAPFPGQNR